MPSPKEKIEGLEEAVRIVRGLWSRSTFTYDGQHSGTFGKRSLAVTGRVANGWILSLAFAPPNRISEMRDRVRTAAEDVGRDPEEITFVYNIEVRIDSTAHTEADVVSGSPEAVADQLGRLVELGLGGTNLMPVGQDLDGQVERLGSEVLPLLRETT